MTEYDTATQRIGGALTFFDKLIFRRARVAPVYYRYWKLFNSAMVEGTGLVIYYVLVPILLGLLSSLPFFWAWTLTTITVVPISFLSKYFIYDRWLFKK